MGNPPEVRDASSYCVVAKYMLSSVILGWRAILVRIFLKALIGIGWHQQVRAPEPIYAAGYTCRWRT
jgi:hypothetical protein